MITLPPRAAHAQALSYPGFADLWAELSDVPLEVTGTLPEGLHGTLYRVVPTAFDWAHGRYDHWFDGRGQVHALTLGPDGARYSNRFIETETYRSDRRTGRPQRGYGTQAPGGWLANVGRIPGGSANTNVLEFDGKVLALQEGSHPVALERGTLATVGPDDLGFLKPGEAFTAHPHVDPATGHVVAVSLQYGRTPLAAVTTFDRSSRLVGRFELPLPYGPAMLHDFGLSRDHIVIPCYPQVANPLKFLAGLESIAGSSQWEPGRGAFMFVTDRSGGHLRRHELPALFSFHVVQCFDEADTVVVDFIASEDGELLKQIGRIRTLGIQGMADFRVYRARLHADGRTDLEVLYDAPAEFPRVDPRRQGTAYRHAFVVGSRSDASQSVPELFGAIARLDTQDGRVQRWLAPADHAVGEPVPVVKAGASADDADVWVLSMVYDPTTHRSRLVVLDGREVEAGPVAEVHLPHHLPLGFHGNFASAR